MACVLCGGPLLDKVSDRHADCRPVILYGTVDGSNKSASTFSMKSTIEAQKGGNRPDGKLN